jgi:hypothetical protein
VAIKFPNTLMGRLITPKSTARFHQLSTAPDILRLTYGGGKLGFGGLSHRTDQRFIVGKKVDLHPGSIRDQDCIAYIQLYHGNASLLAQSLEVIQQASAVILAALRPSVEEATTSELEEVAA